MSTGENEWEKEQEVENVIHIKVGLIYSGSTERKGSKCGVTFQVSDPHLLLHKSKKDKKDAVSDYCLHEGCIWWKNSDWPNQDDLSKIRKLVQQLINECIIKVVIWARGAERHKNGAVWRALQGNDIFINLVPCIWVHLKDIHIHYCNYRPRSMYACARVRYEVRLLTLFGVSLEYHLLNTLYQSYLWSEVLSSALP